MIGLEQVVPPAAEPITLVELKTQARIDDDTEDGWLTGLISAARQRVEQLTGQALLTQSWRLWLDEWPERPWIELPRAPVQSITNVKIYAADGSDSVWAVSGYQLDRATPPPRLLLADDTAWPTPGRRQRGTSIEFVAGYVDVASVPAPLRLAVGQLATHWFEQRGVATAEMTEIPHGVLALLAPYRMLQL